jgi:hypothetical protein
MTNPILKPKVLLLQRMKTRPLQQILKAKALLLLLQRMKTQPLQQKRALKPSLFVGKSLLCTALRLIVGSLCMAMSMI